MQVAEELIASVKPEAAPSFNAHAAGLRGAGQMEEHSTVAATNEKQRDAREMEL